MIDHELYLPRSREDMDRVVAILDRIDAQPFSGVRRQNRLDRQSTLMDMLTVHNSVGLRLDDMLTADMFDVTHDVYGIHRHLNRETGQLEDFFLPRFAVKEDA